MTWRDEIGNSYRLVFRLFKTTLMAPPSAPGVHGPYWVHGGHGRGVLVRMDTWYGEVFFVKPEHMLRLAATPDVQATPDWLPTAENIDAIPYPLRRYVHDLETLCDPAGLMRENAQLKDANRDLQAMYRRVADGVREVPRG